MLYVAIVVYDFCKFSTIFYALRFYLSCHSRFYLSFLSFVPLTFLRSMNPRYYFILPPVHTIWGACGLPRPCNIAVTPFTICSVTDVVTNLERIIAGNLKCQKQQIFLIADSFFCS